MSEVNEIENQEKRREKFSIMLERAANILCDKRKIGDHFNFNPINASSLLRLELVYKKGNNLDLYFLFPRRPQYKPIYKSVRTWFQTEGLSWKDKTIDGERYMAAIIPRQSTEIARLVKSFLSSNFDYDVLIINSQRVSLTYKLINMSIPICMTSIIFIMGSAGTYLVHQVTQIGKLNAPNISNISPYEWILIVIFYTGCLVLNRQLATQVHQMYSKPNVRSKYRLYFWRLVVFLLLPLMALFTG